MLQKTFRQARRRLAKILPAGSVCMCVAFCRRKSSHWGRPEETARLCINEKPRQTTSKKNRTSLRTLLGYMDVQPCSCCGDHKVLGRSYMIPLLFHCFFCCRPLSLPLASGGFMQRYRLRRCDLALPVVSSSCAYRHINFAESSVTCCHYGRFRWIDRQTRMLRVEILQLGKLAAVLSTLYT